ncbi:MAG: 50S ribosomal protein L29 [Candidatus Omnitrophota bacterium]
MLKSNDLRDLSEQELKEKIVSLKKSLYEMRSQASTGHIEKPSHIKELRRDIARVLTILSEKGK